MRRILVVDIDVDILTVVQLILEGNGFKVAAINRWREIFPTIKSFKPDLILLEVSLGTQDGRNVCKQLKSGVETQHISVILVSANLKFEESVVECLANSFISKPFNMDDLVQVINNEINEEKK